MVDATCSDVPCTKGHVINLDYCNVNLLTAIMLGGAYDRGGSSLVVLRSCDLLQSAVGLRQQWRRLFVMKADVAVS